VAPTRRPFPRFVADASQETAPYGRWEERLLAEFARACEPLAAEAGSGLDPETVRWFPDRAWGGRVYVPASGRAAEATTDEDGEPVLAEYYGWISYDPAASDDGGPADLKSKVDFTDVTADDNPDWQMDLNEEVVGGWRGEQGKVAAMTLVWGRPLIDDGAVVCAELARLTVDQAVVEDERFTLLAPDAYREDYLEVALYDGRGNQLARESLYEDDGED
jgi:hypothetical protein